MRKLVYLPAEGTRSQTEQNIHYTVDLKHCDAVIGIDRTNIEKPIFVRFGRAEKVNFESLALAKAHIEQQVLHYIEHLQGV